MCTMVYLAAARPLALVPWDENVRGFHVTTLSPDEERVRAQFSEPFVVYAGSHDGCGCGFQCGEYPDESYEEGELALRRRTLAQFAAYLETELPRVGNIAVFSCWDGDQAEVPRHHRALHAEDFRDPDFHFLDRELSTISTA